MRNTNEIIEDPGVRANAGGCGGCGFRVDMGGRCITYLLMAARAALTEMQDRCARYAEEIMVLREQLKKVRHD